MNHQKDREEPVSTSSTATRPSILPEGKKAGVGMHFTSLASPYGIGDIGDSAQAFVSTLASMKMSVWQFLPTGPTAYGDSPYQPLSAFAGNEMLIGIEPLLRRGLLKDSEAEALAGLSPRNVDYANLIPRKHAVLAKAAGRFLAVADSGLRSAYDDFLHLNDKDWLNDYAIYRILKAQHAERAWPEWDKAFVRRLPDAMRKVRQEHRTAIEKIKIIQFLFDRQWRALRRLARENQVKLFGDMPIYIALDSADAWANPEILLVDETGQPSHVAGVPPDYFSADGQLWGNPLYDWEFHQSNGYQWWIERVHHAANQADMVRVDHFRGFESFWAVRAGAETAREGEWLPGPGDALFDSMRSSLGSLPIVAEDLGIITQEVDGLRQRHHIPGMKVLQFMVGEAGFDLSDISENRVCYTGTHDNDTTLGWFQGAETDTRSEQEILSTRENALRASAGKPESIHLDMIRLAFQSEAKLAIAPMQDYLGLGSEARLNIPGTTSDNWRWRVSGEQLSPGFCETIARMVEEMSRA
jgi:4-alpha-glucanotransferase